VEQVEPAQRRNRVKYCVKTQLAGVLQSIETLLPLILGVDDGEHPFTDQREVGVFNSLGGGIVTPYSTSPVKHHHQEESEIK
jgi:hypothetical protein